MSETGKEKDNVEPAKEKDSDATGIEKDSAEAGIRKDNADPGIEKELENMGLTFYDSMWCLPSTPACLIQDLKEFKFREDDILISSYPKSGVYWVSELIWLINNSVDVAEAAKTPIGLRVPFLEHGNKSLENPLALLNSRPSPRLMKTHWTPGRLPFAPGAVPRTIVIIRNPRDSLAALYMWYKNNNYFSYGGNWDEFYSLFKGNNLVEVNYSDFTSDWWDLRDNENVLIVHYKHFFTKPNYVVNEIAKFCQKSLEGDHVSSLCRWIDNETAKEEGRGNDIYKRFFNSDQLEDLQKTVYFSLASRGLLFLH